jgi:hypothetical protein
MRECNVISLARKSLLWPFLNDLLSGTLLTPFFCCAIIYSATIDIWQERKAFGEREVVRKSVVEDIVTSTERSV